MEWIQIPIPITLFEDQDSNPKEMDSNLDSKKRSESLLEKVDSNPYEMASNLDSSKFAQTGWIRISVKQSQILSEEKEN